MTISELDADVRRMAESITAMLRARPVFFMDLVRAHREAPYRTLLLAWGEVRERHTLSRDDEGHYFLPAGTTAP
jgi:hypothetical protein